MMAGPELDISSPMTKCQCTNFYPLRTLLWFPSLLTCLISLLVIYCFPEWNCTFQGTVFMTYLKFRNNCWWSYMAYHEVSFGWCFQQWQKPGSIVWTGKRTILKRTRMTS